MSTKMKMRAVFDCSADEAGEISFREGDILVDVEESGEDGWYTGRIENSTIKGLFPYNYVEPIPESSPNIQSLSSQPENINTIAAGSPNITIPASTNKPNLPEEYKPLQQDKSSLPGFPPLDAFEAAISSGKSTKISASWTPSNITNSPPVISPKPKIGTTAKKETGLGIKFNGAPPIISEKPQLKSLGLNRDASPTRLRSYSTSSVFNKTEKESTKNADKTLRPSQLVNGKGTKSALELALSKGSPTARPQSNLRSNSFSKPSNLSGSITSGIALPGLSNMSSSARHDVEDEDGYQMVKPSQLRQRQQFTSSPMPLISKSSVSSTVKKPANNATSWKNSSDNTNLISTTSTSSKMGEVVANNPMPRLPSRPTSTASRRSRNSRNSSIQTSPSASSNTSPLVKKLSSSTLKESNTEKPAPPILKPKPQLNTSSNNNGSTPQPNLPPRPNNKSRSTSNPPPLQPKPATMSSIEVLLSKNNTEKEGSSNTPRVHAAKPANYQSNINKPILASKPNSIPNRDNWKSAETSSDDVNIKPSTLLNRARSTTNPTSNTDWSSMMTKSKKADSPISFKSIILEPVAIEPKKKATPPPPPPSRPPKNPFSGNKVDEKHRFEILFESINDDGFIDGETARFIWLKSKLTSEELSRVWRDCDPDHKGLLDKNAFIDGMSRIDDILLHKQTV